MCSVHSEPNTSVPFPKKKKPLHCQMLQVFQRIGYSETFINRLAVVFMLFCFFYDFQQHNALVAGIDF